MLGGMTVAYSRIAHDLGVSALTVQTNCHKLAREGYIQMDRCPHGARFRVAKSKKFAWKRSEETFRSQGRRSEGTCRPDRKKAADQIGRNLPMYIDNTGDLTVDNTKDTPAGNERQAGSRSDIDFINPVIALWTNHFGVKPSWDKKHYVQLASLRKRRPDMAPEEFIDRYKTFLNANDQFWSKQKGSLGYFCANYDLFVSDATRAIDEIPYLVPEDAAEKLVAKWRRENAEEERRRNLLSESGESESAVAPPREQMRAVLAGTQSTGTEGRS